MKLSEIKITPILDSLKLENISDEEYFSKKYENYVSNSRLSLINPEQDGCPKDFFEGLSKHNIYSDSLIFGSAIHELVLQPESFVLCNVVNRPTAKAGAMADELYKPSGIAPTDSEIIKASNKIEYYKGKMNAKRISDFRTKCNKYWRDRALFEHSLTPELASKEIYLDEKSRSKIDSCLNSLKHNKDIQNLLYPTGIIHDPIIGNERTILLDVKIETPKGNFIIRLKSKLDNFSIYDDTITVNDLKTTGRPITEFGEVIKKYHYNRELGMYAFLLKLCAERFYNTKNPKIKGNFLVVETFPNFSTKVYPMTNSLFNSGFNEFSKLLKLVSFYCVNGYESFQKEL